MTEEEIAKRFVKDVTTKTILVSFEDLQVKKKEYLDDGWELVKVSTINGRFKLTFQKVK